MGWPFRAAPLATSNVLTIMNEQKITSAVLDASSVYGNRQKHSARVFKFIRLSRKRADPSHTTRHESVPAHPSKFRDDYSTYLYFTTLYCSALLSLQLRTVPVVQVCSSRPWHLRMHNPT